MTYHLIGAGTPSAIGATGSLIKASERAHFEQAADLLAQLTEARARLDDDIAERRAAAQAEGFAEGKAAVETHVGDALAALAEGVAAHEAQRRSEIADAAFAAVQAIIGAIPADIALSGIVAQTVARMDAQGEGALHIEVAPAMLDALAARLPAETAALLRSNPALGAQDCTVVTDKGSLVASLDVQLESLAQRWGVARGSGVADVA